MRWGVPSERQDIRIDPAREDAEDLVQETYAKVRARPRLLRNDDDLGYLLRVLRNTYVSSRRASARRPQAQAVAEDFEPTDPRTGARPDEMAEAREVFAAIAERIGVAA
jgi:RNA polymerase sigma-70 factor (ECF subfamily)